jgi:hypothetical protein
MVPLLLQLLFLSKLMGAIFIAPPEASTGKYFKFPLLDDLKSKQTTTVNIFDTENKAILHEVIGEISKQGVIPT